MSAEEPRSPLYVWDLVVRVTHWTIVIGILVLSATGFYIGNPFVTVSGPAGQHFFMGWVKVVHFYAAIAFSLAVVSRIVWMFIGTRWARWDQFVPVARERRRDFVGTIKFYSFLRSTPPPAVGHNPVAGFTYVFVFLIYLGMIATGLGLYGMDAHVGSAMRWFAWFLPFLGGAQSARWLHHVGMYLLLGFMVHHVYSAMLMAKVEKNGVMDSIFSGFKNVTAYERRNG